MKRALLKDWWDTIWSHIRETYSADSPVRSIVSYLFGMYEYDDTIELIFPDDIENLEQFIKDWLSRRTAMYKPYIDKLYKDGNFKTPDVTDRIVNREVNTTGNSASELQPINADINEITSPTSKGKTITNGDETRTEKSPEFYMELLKYQSESEPLYRLVRKAYLPILELYDKIY